MSVKKKWILAGGGHFHSVLLRELLRAPRLRDRVLDNYHLTLITPFPETVYSGHFTSVLHEGGSRSKSTIPVRDLARKAGIEFFEERVTSLIPEKREIRSESGRHEFDLLTVNTGGVSDDIGGDSVSIRPLTSWNYESLDPSEPWVLCGGGWVGCELALALRAWAGIRGHTPRIEIIEKGDRLLKGAPASMARRVRAELDRAGITVRLGHPAPDRGRGRLLACTPPQAPAWIRDSGLELDSGRIRVSTSLGTSHPRIFAVGDGTASPYPPTGVTAVKAAPRWLDRLLSGTLDQDKPLVHQNHLQIMALSRERATAAFGPHDLGAGRHWRKIKHLIDRRFLEGFRQLV